MLAEVARRGFVQLAASMRAAAEAPRGDPVRALEDCAQAHLAYAAGERPVYAAMFDPNFPVADHLDLARARDDAFAVLRAAAAAASERSKAQRRPPALMIALHVWALTHGIAVLYLGRSGAGQLPMRPTELLEAGLLVYLQSLGLEPSG